MLVPLSWLYCSIVYLRFLSTKERDFGVKIIGVGNLSVGGSGKTPLVTALAQGYSNAAIILRGYGRDSKGLYLVKDAKEILCDVSISGDEAMIYAQKLPNAIVIVSEDRVAAIEKAKEMGARVLFLDDAYSKHSIKKLDIVIDIVSENMRCLPAGPFRERLWSSKEVVLVEDGVDFQRRSILKDAREKMSLVTAIARPERLDAFLPEVVAKHYFADHYSYSKKELEDILAKDGSESLLVTYKDYVKIVDFGLPLSLLDLELDIESSLLKRVREFTDM